MVNIYCDSQQNLQCKDTGGDCENNDSAYSPPNLDGDGSEVQFWFELQAYQESKR